MSRAKAFIILLMALILIALSGMSVWAAPGESDEPTVISGEVQGIVIEVDEETETTTVLVTLADDLGEETQVRLSLEAAAKLGLMQTDENGDPIFDDDGEPIINENAIGGTVEIDPNDVIEPEQPPEEPTVISGEVQNIVIEVDEEGTITVLVTLADGQTIRLSLETAAKLGLVQTDENGDPIFDDDGNPIINEDAIGGTVEIDPSDVIEDGEEEGEEGPHPVASALAEFFADTLGLDYDMVMGYHEDGMGFGVIAQACWMSYAMEGDATLLGDILEAKKSHDFSSIELPDGGTAKNWGQFKKAVLGSDKAKKNLGAIMSGRAKKEQEQEQEQEQEMTATANQSQGKGKKGKGLGGEDSGSSTEPPGKGKDKDKGGGPPDESPGQGKDKDKGGGNDKSGGSDKGSGGDKDKGGGKGKNK